MARKPEVLAVALAAYFAASLLHFAHNAEFAADYPNLPASLTAGKIYGAWLGITAVGAFGGLLLWKGHTRTGLAILALYAAQGFDGLFHYHLAPMASHTAMMNFTIWFEVAMAAVLLTALALQGNRS